MENSDLKNLDYFKPVINDGFVLKVYDGDTIIIACRPSNTDGKLYKYSVRIAGIDCPEIKSNNEKEKLIAERARDELNSLLFEKMVFLKNISLDKYSKRIVADVLYEEIDIGKWLIEKRLAVPYDGKTKNPPKCWEKFHLGLL